YARQSDDAWMARRPVRSRTAQPVALPEAWGRHQRGCCAGVAATGVVVSRRARDRAAAGRAQSGKGRSDEPARDGARELALALHRSHAVDVGLGVAARLDARLGTVG